jgi:flagellum-specific peptidoglycan hydrolase FlgJ
MTKEEFVEQAYTAALQSSESSGMPAMVTVAQAALESNWGQSKLSQEAHNYFGIKAHGSQDRIQMSTAECEHGANVVIHAEFARYGSMLDCFQIRDKILLHGASYAGAREHLNNEVSFISEIAKHWATDPKYAVKLETMLREVKALVGARQQPQPV